MPKYISDSSDDDQSSPPVKLFGRRKPVHAALGGGKVADVLLWRKKSLSATLLAGFTMIWYLFEVVEYHFITLLCHIFIISLLVLFIWSLLGRSPPELPKINLSESDFKLGQDMVNRFLLELYKKARGEDRKLFVLALPSLWILSVIGNQFSTLSLLYYGLICIETLPFFYERYDKEVDYLANKGYREMKKLFRKFESRVLNKIPKAPVKEKKRL